MRVLQVLGSIDPRLGGPVVCAQALAEWMPRFGVSAEVLSLEAPARDWLTDWPQGVHWLGDTMGTYRYCKKLRAWLQQNACRYEAIIVHGVWQYQTIGISRGLRGQAWPAYHVLVHGMLDPWFRQAHPFKHVKKAIYWRLFESSALRDASSVIFTSEEEMRLASRSFGPLSRNARVVRMGMPPPPRESPNQTSGFFQKFPTLAGKRILLFLGRLHRVKGCDLLIRAFAQVGVGDSRLHLLIAGQSEGGERSRFEHLARKCGVPDRITWTGQLAGDLKWGAYRAAEAFVLPSHTESFGYAIVEALACGLPVLTTNKVKIRPFIVEECAGLIADDNLGGVRDLLNRWMQLDAERRSELCRKARACYEKHFEMESFVARLIDVLVKENRTAEPLRGASIA